MKKICRKKLIATLVLFFFASSGNVYPQQASGVQDAVPTGVGGVNPSSASVQQIGKAPIVQADINPYNIAIPEQFGNIEEVFQGAQNSPLIVHIQNVHANYEAQVNIKAILNHLVDKYNFSLIQLEGAVSKLDPTILEPSYLKEANLKLVDFLMREGRITGADAFAVETNKPVELYGIEDYSLYAENLKTFKTVYSHQTEVKTYFDEIHRLIQNVGPKLFNPENLDFTRKTEEFAGDKIDILDYLVYMNKLLEKHQLGSLNDMKEIVRYPNLVRIMRLQRLQDQLNKNGLKKETEALKAEFRKKMPDSEKVEKLLERLDDSTKGVTPRSYFLELTEAAQEAKIDFIGYPAFRIFAEFLIHQDEIDHKVLFSELKQFENYLQKKLFTAEDEKALLEIIDFTGLLEQYFRLEMSREKLVLYLKHRDTIKPSLIVGRLTELAKKYEVIVKPVDDLQKLDSYIDQLEYFYQLVLKRDEVFTEKILGKMQSLNQDKTIIVTGGFHKDGLRDHFRKENISYVVINPKVDIKQGSESYLKVMLEGDAVVGSVFAGTFALEASNIRNPDKKLYLGGAYGAGSVFTEHLDTSFSMGRMNARLVELAPRAGVGLNINSEQINDFSVFQRSEVRFFDVNGAPRESTLVANLNRKNLSVQVNEEVRKVPSPAELKKFGIRPPEKLGTIARTDLPNLSDRLVITETFQAPFKPYRPLKETLLAGVFVPSKDLGSERLETLLSLRENPEAVQALRSELRGQDISDNGELLRLVQQSLKSTGLAPEIPETAIVQAVSNDQDRNQLKFISSTNRVPAPRILIVHLDEQPEIRDVELRSLLETVRANAGAIAVVYGANVSQLATPEVLRADQKLLSRMKFIDIGEAKAMTTIERDISSGRVFNFYISLGSPGGRLTIRELKEGGFARFMGRAGVQLGSKVTQVPGLNVIQLDSMNLKTPEIVRDSTLREGVIWTQVHFLDLLPTEKERDGFNAALIKNGLPPGIIVQVGKNEYRIGDGFLGLIKRLMTDYMAAVAVASAA